MTETTKSNTPLTEWFGSIAENDDFINECKNLMKQFTLTEEELYWKWESYVLKKTDSSLKPSVNELRNLQEYIMAALEKENKSATRKPMNPRIPGSATRKPVNVSSPDAFLDSMLSTPGSLKRKMPNQTPSRVKELKGEPDDYSSPNKTPRRPLNFNNHDNNNTSPTKQETPFKLRKDAGKTIETLNENILEVEKRVERPLNNVQFQLNVDLKKYHYRTMRMKLSEVAEYFDDKIEQLIESLLKYNNNNNNNITDDQIGNPANMSQSEIVAVGRIVADSVDKLNPGSLLFETCRRVGAGMQVRLDVSQLSSYSFFPGQILAIRGINNDGRAFQVNEIIPSPYPFISAATSKDDIKEIITRQHLPQSIITAAGPFTTSDNLYFEPLDDLVTEINQSLPDVVILVGPLLDISHPMIQSGDFEIPSEDGISDSNTNGTLDDFFRTVITPKLNSINSETTVIIIPSVRDACTNHAAFPQPPLDRKQLGLNKNLKCLSNPATFSLNEVVFSVNSIDSIRDLVATMTQLKPQHAGLHGAISHILSSRSMYPVFPSSQELNGGSLDIPFMGLAEFTYAMPDVLITPSIMKPLAELFSNVVVVNPGLLAKRTGAGTYAVVNIKPPSEPSEDSEETVNHEIWNRARVDLKKL